MSPYKIQRFKAIELDNDFQMNEWMNTHDFRELLNDLIF